MSDVTMSQNKIHSSFLTTMADSVCRRAFSSPEAFLYELTIARALADVVTPELAKSATGRVLDVGAGGGKVALRMVKESGCEVVALDPSRSQIRRIESLAKREPSLKAQIGSATSLPFADATFDSVVSSCSWKHWPDAVQGVSECLRVLRPGGVLTIIEIDGSVTPEAFWRFAKSSAVPLGMKRAYLRFAMRTVVGVAPQSRDLENSFGSTPVEVTKLGAMPFLVARAVRR